MKCIYLCLFTALVFAISSTNGGVAKTKREATETINEEEARALAWIAELDEEINLKKNKGAISGWKYASNITDENEKENNKVSLELAKELKVSEILSLLVLQIKNNLFSRSPGIGL